MPISLVRQKYFVMSISLVLQKYFVMSISLARQKYFVMSISLARQKYYRRVNFTRLLKTLPIPRHCVARILQRKPNRRTEFINTHLGAVLRTVGCSYVGNDVTHSTLLDRVCAGSYKTLPKYRSYRVSNTAP